jgi:hypothetical protein
MRKIFILSLLGAVALMSVYLTTPSASAREDKATEERLADYNIVLIKLFYRIEALESKAGLKVPKELEITVKPTE